MVMPVPIKAMRFRIADDLNECFWQFPQCVGPIEGNTLLLKHSGSLQLSCSECVANTSVRHRRSQGGAMTPKFPAYLAISCFERR